ncbi:MAG: DUF4019 domain-containing protein [Candidatus Korobacteraceae bacterium]|jgi:hypothetical protein
MKLRVAVVALLIVALAGVTLAEDKTKAAEAAAEAWLELLDSGHYAQSWQDFSSMFKAAVGEKEWEQQMRAVRTPLGEMISRKVRSADFATQLPGVPDGQYVVIRYETSFANKKSAIETVTPMLDKDGQWHVSGYFIK